MVLETTQRESELAHYRAVDEERAKGEKREARLVAQLKELRKRRVFLKKFMLPQWPCTQPHSLGVGSQVIVVQREGCTVILQEGSVVARSESLGVHGGTSAGALEPIAAPTLVAQHLPPLSKFSGGAGG